MSAQKRPTAVGRFSMWQARGRILSHRMLWGLCRENQLYRINSSGWWENNRDPQRKTIERVLLRITEREIVDTSVRRGDIFYADLSPVVGSEQGGVRPVLIIQNDMGNRHSPTVIAAAITSQLNKAKLPTHIELLDPHCGLTKDSVVLLEQIRTLDKRRLRERMGRLDEERMAQVDTAIAVSFGLRSRTREV